MAISTQIAQSDPRKVFPFFSLVSFRAIFNFKISCETKYNAISKKYWKENNKKTIIFNRTLKMSSYILEWVVLD